MGERIINIRQAVEQLESFLGISWLKEKLTLIKKSHGGKVSFGCGIGSGCSEVAYVAYLWYRAQEELVFSEISGMDDPGPYSLHAAVIGEDLTILRECTGLTKKIEALKTIDQSLRAMCELGLATGYLRRGYEVEFIDNGFKLPDQGIHVYCMELDPGSLVEKEFKLTTGHPVTENWPSQSKQILYLHIAGNNHSVEHLLHLRDLVPDIQRITGVNDMSILIYWTGLQNINNRLCFVRTGRLLRSTKSSLDNDIYIPDELIRPGN